MDILFDFWISSYSWFNSASLDMILYSAVFIKSLVSCNSFITLENWNFLSVSSSIASLYPLYSNVFKSTSIGTFVSSSINFLLSSSCSALFNSASFTFGGNLSTFFNALSTVPNSLSIFAAVFSPIPGTPGTLSDVSPTSER